MTSKAELKAKLSFVALQAARNTLAKHFHMKPEPGTYALILRSRSNAKVQVGRWGWFIIEPGYYIYVGSAFGPGGVQARVSRHCRKHESKHWHIDYLREYLSPVGAWYSYETRELEHRWAQLFSDMADTSSVKGFGCSDCKCYSHLFTISTKPDFAQFSKNQRSAVNIQRSALHSLFSRQVAGAGEHKDRCRGIGGQGRIFN